MVVVEVVVVRDVTEVCVVGDRVEVAVNHHPSDRILDLTSSYFIYSVFLFCLVFSIFCVLYVFLCCGMVVVTQNIRLNLIPELATL